MSSDHRNAMLEGIRRSLGRSALSITEVELIHARIVDSQTAPRPQWDGNTWGRFIDKFEAAAGTIEVIDAIEDIPEAVSNFVRQHGLSNQIAIAEHPDLASLQWPGDWELIPGTELERAPLGLTVAYGGVAETGTLALLSGPSTPTRLNFLPEYCIVLVHAEDLFDYYEQLWARLAGEDGFPPRAVNLITGPSRTADVEQTIQLGAHGPRELHVLLLNESPSRD